VKGFGDDSVLCELPWETSTQERPSTKEEEVEATGEGQTLAAAWDLTALWLRPTLLCITE
jgi:hypothetical protein